MLVSVVIPAFNCSKTIDEAIKSVFCQSYNNYEIIVVNDGSTDDTQSKVHKYRGKVKYIKQNNSGPSSARNRGIKSANGDLIAFLDADDIWCPEKLKMQIDLMKNDKSIDMVVTSYEQVIENNIEHKTPKLRQRNNIFFLKYKELLVRNSILTSTVLAKKKCIENVGLFDEEIWFGEDWDLWLKIGAIYKICFINRQLCKYRVHINSISRNTSPDHFSDWRKIIERHTILPKKNFVKIISYMRAMSWYFYNYSYYEKVKGNRKKSYEYFFYSLLYWPVAMYGKYPLVLSFIKELFDFLKKFFRETKSRTG
jgi:glycosyltransferase involved in cell wall biosynthesis